MINDAYVSDIVERLAQLATQLLDGDTYAPLDRAAVVEVLQAMEARSAAHGLRGLTYLFRMLHKLPVAWPATGFNESDRIAFDEWIGDCCGYVLGGESHGSDRLVDAVLSLSFMLPVAPRARELLVLALADDALKLKRAAARRDIVVSGLNAMGDADAIGAEGATEAVIGVAAESHADMIGDHDAAGAIVCDALAAASATTPAADAEIANTASEDAANEDMSAGTAAATAAATSIAETGEPPDDAVWVSVDEFALIREAVETQLLPTASTVLEQYDAPNDAQIAAIDACLDQLELIEAAVDALALTGLQRACAAYRRLTERLRGDPAFASEDAQGVGLWPVLLIGHLESPLDADAAGDLVALLDERGVFADGESASVLAALGAISIGIDPAQRLTRKRIAEPDDVALELAPDVLPGVLAGMLQELPGRSAEFSASVQRYVREHAAHDLDHAQRIAHTLKGDGNIVGLRGIANLTHALEEILSALAAAPQRANAQIDALLVDAADCLESMSDHVLGRGPPPEHAISDLQRVYDCANALFEDTDEFAAEIESDPAEHAPEAEVEHDAPAQNTAPRVAEPAPPAGDAPATITVPMRLLDDLLRLTGEAVIHARQVEDRVARVERHHADISTQGRTFQSLIAQLQQLVEVRGAALDMLRLAGALDDLELDRYNELHTVTLRLVEAAADARTSADELDGDVLNLRDLLSQQDRVQLDVREHVMQARQIAVHEISPRLQRVVRQTSRQLEKPCELHIDGDDVPLDKDLVDALAEPLLHVLRNAVDHGLETPARRAELGKPAIGRIDLSYRRDASSLVVLCRDDGAGLDTDAIRRRAIERGLIAANAELDEAELASLVLRSGFSTRRAATLTSGRGIGMDIVHRRIVELKGVLNLRSRRDRGCEIEFRLPLSQVSANVLMVEAASTPIAIGLDGVARMVALSGDDLAMRDGSLHVRLDDATFAAARLETLLGFDASARANATERHALIVEPANEAPFAVIVDAVGDARAVIVKNLGPHVPPNPGLLGATILGDGVIAPVVDLQQLLRRRAMATPVQPAAIVEATTAPSVLIVDDSLSVRRSLEQLVGDAGFRVTTARDGLEALERVSVQRPDLLIVDLEMPRMNGLELASFVRKADATRAVPIIMITSRTTERHRELARAAGVDVTLGKPYSEDGLLGLIADLLQRGRAAA